MSKPPERVDGQRTNATRVGRWAAAVGIVAVAICVRLPWLSSPGFAADQTQFFVWSEMTCRPSVFNPPGGLPAVYDPRPDGSGRLWCNYPPAYVYVLHGLGAVYGWLAPAGASLSEVVRETAHGDTGTPVGLACALYKTPAILADALMGAVLFLLLSRRRRWRMAAGVALLYVMLPAVIHNSTLWGQVDAIPTLLLVLSVEMALRRRVLWMTFLAVLAVLTKSQSLLLLPLWLAVVVQWGVRDVPRRQLKDADDQWPMAYGLRLMAIIGVAMLTLVIVLFPFRHALHGVWQAYIGAANYYPYTHLNGFSLWFLGAPMIEPHLTAVPLWDWYVRDVSTGLLGISLRLWGLIGVGSVWALVGARLWRQRCSADALVWATRVLPLAFFVLSTQMHERYLFAAMALWAFSFVPTARWWICWAVICLCASVNVFWVWPGPPTAFWVHGMNHWLHRYWFGLAPGVWCSAGLIVIFVLATLGWIGPYQRVPSAPRHPPEQESQ